MSQINETAIKTPGVYTTEIPLFPPSVAQVATAIPAFIGYTEWAARKGQSLLGKPTKISSMVEFRQLFGGPFIVSAGNFDLHIDSSNNVTNVVYNKMFYMFDAIRHYFDNGGGSCYIVSVGFYTADIIAGDESLTPATGLRGGVKAIEIYDEPTLILFPDAVQLAEPDFFSLQQMALLQCADLQDRFCVFDLKENIIDPTPWQTAVDNFKDKIGITDLNYAACYTPWLVSTYTKDISFSLLDGHVFDNPTPGSPPKDLALLTATPKINALVTTYRNNAVDQAAVQNNISALCTDSGVTPAVVYPTILDRYNKLKNEVITSTDVTAKDCLDKLIAYMQAVLISLPGIQTGFVNPKLKETFDDLGKNPGSGLGKYVADLVGIEKNISNISLGTDNSVALGAYDTLFTTWLLMLPPPNATTPMRINAITANANNYNPSGSAGVHDQSLNVIGDLDAVIAGINSFINNILNATQSYVKLAQDSLYKSHPIINNMVLYMQRELSKLPPSGAVVGIYSRVDGTRGVWKAPANETVFSVIEPSVMIDDKTQASLNVDDVAGKSINAIRSFTGKGTLVWGARTLDGNSNEWRFISVRRFFIMVEESAKKSSGRFVFEPNDANTWVKVRGMLENYLTVLWRQGALAGAKPEQAFFVKCGLGQTMTSDDINEGKLIVEIGMAAVRPAEFIVLRFMHKLQES